jgi:hypothetical protein
MTTTDFLVGEAVVPVYLQQEAEGTTLASDHSALGNNKDGHSQHGDMLKFASRCRWRFKSSEMLHRVDWYIVADVSKDPTAFIFRVTQPMKTLLVFILSGLLDF